MKKVKVLVETLVVVEVEENEDSELMLEEAEQYALQAVNTDKSKVYSVSRPDVNQSFTKLVS